MGARINMKDLPPKLRDKYREEKKRKPGVKLPKVPLRGDAEVFVSVTLPWPPSVNHYYHQGRYLRKEVRKYREAVAEACMRERVGHVIGSDVEVTIFAFASDARRRDCDNILKGVLDALVKARVIDDDSQIAVLEVRRSNTIVETPYLGVNLTGDLPA